MSLSEREARLVVVRAESFTIGELCRAEQVAISTKQWWLAEQIRRAIAHKCIEGGEQYANQVYQT